MCKIIFLLFFSLNVVAINIEYLGGNISYKHLSGTCPGISYYEITVHLYTKTFKTAGDSIKLDWPTLYVKRTDSIIVGNNILKSVYKTIFAFPSCGNYLISYTDTINIQNAKNINILNKEKFRLSATLVLNPFYPPVSSYTSFCTPAIKILKNKLFTFNNIVSTNNTLVYDSIIHSLYSTIPFSSYGIYIPSGVKINRYSGEIQWTNPDTLSSYVFMPITKMYKYGYEVCSSNEYYNFEVINHNPNYVYDSISKVPTNTTNFKEIVYTVGNTYSFTSVYTDASADSIRTLAYPIDFFNTAPSISIIKNNTNKHTLNFSWSPIAIDDRLYPYNFVLNTRSYYGADSVANTYQTVSFKSSIINEVKESIKDNNDLLIYPNPTYNKFVIDFSSIKQIGNAKIQIYNTVGSLVNEQTENINYASKLSLDVSNYSKGIYFINVLISNNTYKTKLIIQ